MYTVAQGDVMSMLELIATAMVKDDKNAAFASDCLVSLCRTLVRHTSVRALVQRTVRIPHFAPCHAHSNATQQGSAPLRRTPRESGSLSLRMRIERAAPKQRLRTHIQVGRVVAAVMALSSVPARAPPGAIYEGGDRHEGHSHKQALMAHLSLLGAAEGSRHLVIDALRQALGASGEEVDDAAYQALESLLASIQGQGRLSVSPTLLPHVHGMPLPVEGTGTRAGTQDVRAPEANGPETSAAPLAGEVGRGGAQEMEDKSRERRRLRLADSPSVHFSCVPALAPVRARVLHALVHTRSMMSWNETNVYRQRWRNPRSKAELTTRRSGWAPTKIKAQRQHASKLSACAPSSHPKRSPTDCICARVLSAAALFD